MFHYFPGKLAHVASTQLTCQTRDFLLLAHSAGACRVVRTELLDGHVKRMATSARVSGLTNAWLGFAPPGDCILIVFRCSLAIEKRLIGAEEQRDRERLHVLHAAYTQLFTLRIRRGTGQGQLCIPQHMNNLKCN